MRCVFSRLLHSLAVRLLCTYIAALLVTMASIAAVVWFSADQEAGVTAKVQLQKLTEIMQKRIRFNSARPPGIGVTFPAEFSWVFQDFAADGEIQAPRPIRQRHRRLRK